MLFCWTENSEKVKILKQFSFWILPTQEEKNFFHLTIFALRNIFVRNAGRNEIFLLEKISIQLSMQFERELWLS
jgi:hypothetical protein